MSFETEKSEGGSISFQDDRVDGEEIDVNVKNIDAESTLLKATRTTKIEELVQQYIKKSGISNANVYLSYKGKILKGDETLNFQEAQNNEITLHVIIRLKGGLLSLIQ